MDSILDWSLAKCFSVVTIFGSEGTDGMVIYRLGSFPLLQLFLQLGDMLILDCFLQVLWLHTCDLYPNPSLFV